MTDKQSTNQVIPYRRPIRLNVGLIMFLVIFTYVLISLISYLTSHKTEVYEVRSGSLSDNLVYQGIAIRGETVVNSDYTGTLNFYNKEGERIPVGGLAFSVDEIGKITDYLSDEEEAFLSEEDLQRFRSEAISFSKKFSPGKFVSVYDFRSSAVSSAQKISNRKVLSGIPDLASTTIHPCYAEETGEILYFVDNCEGITFENLTVEDFDRTGYKKNQITNGSRITAGEPAYKIVTDENWSVAIHVASAQEASDLVQKGYIQVRFLENQMVSWASVSSRSDENDNYYVNLRFNNSMSDFCSDRFVDVELIAAQKSGLKVPNSSITKGSFFLVPKEFVYEGAGGQTGVLLEIYTENNEKSVQFVAAVPYSENKEYYYLDDSVLRAGEIIDRPNSSEQYTIGEQDELIGVYYINKGYPDFRQVNILYQNEEYAIVEPNSYYGLQEYDYIVLYADSISMNDYY
ncbi:MAG: hypothetical protein K6G34_05050 [Lachnospiraceae bacterium]|nr:hypothetical protein [Lachnospiraceae bacterium]